MSYLTHWENNETSNLAWTKVLHFEFLGLFAVETFAYGCTKTILFVKCNLIKI